MDENNSWKEWRNHVLSTMEKLDNRIEKLEEKDVQNKIEISKLTTTSKLYGSVYGMVVSAIFSVIAGLVLFHFTSNVNMSTVNDINSNNRPQVEESVNY